MEMNSLFEQAIARHASDLHLLPDLPPLLRIDGTLAPIKDMPKLARDEVKQLLYSLLTPLQIENFEKYLVLEMAYSAPSGNFRVSIYHQLHGVAGVFRVVPQKIPTFEELELPMSLKPLLTVSHGIILVAGPTGSGKSTTLAALVDYINTYRICNIFTIEDPIEYIHHNKRSILNQIQVGRDALNFAQALRSSLRQDPDVIMLGELRDIESMRLALTAAETGHLVLATIHASSSSLAISRFADVFPQDEKTCVRMLLSEVIQGVICQRLAKRITGGRVAAFEIMLPTPSVRNFIRQDMPSHLDSAIHTGSDKGMISMAQYVDLLVKNRVITALIASSITNELQTSKDIGKKQE